MGQKSNPNSFNLIKKKANIVNSSHYVNEYSILLKEYFSVSQNLSSIFEKNNCIVKNCFFLFNNEKVFITFFISFFVLKPTKRNKPVSSKKVNSKGSSISLIPKILLILSKFGYSYSKRLIFLNLNQLAENKKNRLFFGEYNSIRKRLWHFQKENYFKSGLSLFCLMNTTRNTSLLFAKFISYYFKIFHRTKKINKFLLFLLEFVKSISSNKSINTRIKGLKIKIKGRFKRKSRTKSRIFEKGRIPLQTIKNNIVYSLIHVHTSYGIFGVKVWIFE